MNWVPWSARTPLRHEEAEEQLKLLEDMHMQEKILHLLQHMQTFQHG